nr:hypothetical protein [Tanacetum cinerariifolium]
GLHKNLRIQLPPTEHSAHVEDIVASATAIARIFLYPEQCDLFGSGISLLLAVGTNFTRSGKFFWQWELYSWQWECLVHFIPNRNRTIYNRRTNKIMETMNVSFDELSAMAFEQQSSKPGLQSMTSGQISSGLDLTYSPSTITTQQPFEGELELLFEAMYDDYC